MIEKTRGDITSPEGRKLFDAAGFALAGDPEIYYSATQRCWVVARREKLSKKFLGFTPSQGTEYRGVFVVWRMPAEESGRVQYSPSMLQAHRNPRTGRVRFKVPSRYVQ